jgi:hypothetical protein
MSVWGAHVEIPQCGHEGVRLGTRMQLCTLVDAREVDRGTPDYQP